jgi:hypothetical protein
MVKQKISISQAQARHHPFPDINRIQTSHYPLEFRMVIECHQHENIIAVLSEKY